MKVTVIPCGEVVNESEALAIDRLKRELENVATPPGLGPDDRWILLCNLAFSVTHRAARRRQGLPASGGAGCAHQHR